MILGMTMPVFGGVLAGAIVALLLLTVLIGRIRNRGYDFDDDDDDDDFFDDDDDDDDDFFSSFQSKPMPSRSTPAARSPPSSGGHSSEATAFKRLIRQNEATRWINSSIESQDVGSPGGAKPTPSPARRTPVTQSPETEQVEDATPQKKVRKARIEVDMSLFEDWQADDRDAAVEWVIGELGEGEQERTLLMQLQGTGWSAEQSRAIYDMARNQQ